MPTKRKPLRADWPPHLYERRGYFSWRHPVTRKEYGLGKIEAEAIEAAKEANTHIKRSLPERIAQPARTLGEFLPIYRAHLKTVVMAKNTAYARASHLKAFSRIAWIPISTRYEDAPIITHGCSEFLETYVNAGKRRQAKALRATLLNLFACMASKGWLTVNPVRDLRLPAPEVKRQRLTLADFQAIYKVAPEIAAWLPRAMELGIVTLQRIDDISNMTFRAAEAERFKVVQKKTGARLRIPLDLRLNALGWSLADIISRCRDLILSKHLVHHVTHQGRAKPGMKVHPTTLSAAFTAARKRAGIGVDEGNTPPTFHELRSLGIRLYEAEGYKPQDLAGHKDEKTTALYRDDRGAEWIDVGMK